MKACEDASAQGERKSKGGGGGGGEKNERNTDTGTGTDTDAQTQRCRDAKTYGGVGKPELRTDGGGAPALEIEPRPVISGSAPNVRDIQSFFGISLPCFLEGLSAGAFPLPLLFVSSDYSELWMFQSRPSQPLQYQTRQHIYIYFTVHLG